MKVFLDTNVILEGLLRREYAVNSEQVMRDVMQGSIDAYISAGSFHTITYFADKQLRKAFSNKEESLSQLRKVLNSLLDCLYVVGQSNFELAAGVNDESFDDLEDSYQMQAAISAQCDVLLTINTSDFPNESEVKVIHLKDYNTL